MRTKTKKNHKKHNKSNKKAVEEKEEKVRKEIMRSGTINQKYVPAIGTENREKFSLFGQIVNKG
jgi:hypothetical protein